MQGKWRRRRPNRRFLDDRKDDLRKRGQEERKSARVGMSGE